MNALKRSETIAAQYKMNESDSNFILEQAKRLKDFEDSSFKKHLEINNGKYSWVEIEELGREKYNLSDDWYLEFADSSDKEVIKAIFRKKLNFDDWDIKEGYIIRQ